MRLGAVDQSMRRSLIASLASPFARLLGRADPLDRRPRGMPDLRLLTPLLELVPPAPPPLGLLIRIEQQIGAARRSRWMPQRMAGVGLIGAASGAAAMLALVPLMPAHGPEAPLPLAMMDGADRVAMLSARTLGDGRYLRIDHFGLQVPAGRAFELWLLRDGSGRPESLGLLAAGSGMTVLVLGQRISAGDVLAISEEPLGGAAGPGPTGPVIVTARVQTPT